MSIEQIEIIERPHVVAVKSTGQRIVVGEPSIQIITASKVGDPGPQGLIGETGPGVNWLGAYSGATTYNLNDAISYGGSSWRALRTSAGVSPVEGLDWTIIAQKGDTGAGDKTYVHNQGAPASIWNIPHNLSKRPSIMVVDSGETVVLGEIVYIDDNNVRLEFSASFGGKAYLN